MLLGERGDASPHQATSRSTEEKPTPFRSTVIESLGEEPVAGNDPNYSASGERYCGLPATAVFAQESAEGSHAEESRAPQCVDVAWRNMVRRVAGIENSELIANQTCCDHDAHFGAIRETS
jgi:hypothetical protein